LVKLLPAKAEVIEDENDTEEVGLIDKTLTYQVHIVYIPCLGKK